MNVNNELIHFYAKQLKIPTFANYTEVLRQADPASDFSQLLLELMKAEAAARQENQNRRPVSYTHLDVYKRQRYACILWLSEPGYYNA